MIRICFVCLGNICRSPTAEGVMSAMVQDAGLADQIAIDSAGTGAWHVGEPADARSAEVARQRGIELTSRARKFTAADFDRFDHVIAMDRHNRTELLRMARSEFDRVKIKLLRSYDPDAPPDAEVPDPYYGGPRGFDRVLDICEDACRGLLGSLRAELERRG